MIVYPLQIWSFKPRNLDVRTKPNEAVNMEERSACAAVKPSKKLAVKQAALMSCEKRGSV